LLKLAMEIVFTSGGMEEPDNDTWQAENNVLIIHSHKP
jgi:hypothetical protein